MAHAEAGDSPDTMVQETLEPAQAAHEQFTATLADGECVLFVELTC